MTLFLHHPAAFQFAYDLYLWRAVANTMSHHQLPPGALRFDNQGMTRFRAAIVSYFGKQAKGERCNIRAYKDHDVHVILIGRGDYMHTQLVLEDDGEIRPRFFRPAKEDVLLFDRKKRLISIKTSGKGTADREEYLTEFGRCLLHKSRLELDGPTVSLQPIQSRSFRYDGNEAIEWVRLVEVQLRLYGANVTRLGVNSSDVLKTLRSDLPGLRLADCELLSAKLKFKLQGEGMSRRPITVEIRPPEHTSLNKRREADVVEAYLREQGVLLA